MKKLQTDQLHSQNFNFWFIKSKYEYLEDWFMMDSTLPIVAVLLAYLLFVLKLGPAFMKNRKPFDLKNVLILYNAIQVGISLAMFIYASNLILSYGMSHPACMPESREQQIHLISGGYYYFLCKMTELLDTVFFVLRKKDNQVSFLHVYHHTVMVWNGWFFIKYDPGSWMLFLSMLNSFVHVIMYAYYGLSAYPSLRKYLWWKKYITSMQLIQFVLLLLHFTSLFIMTECRPQRSTVIYYYSNVLLFFCLFSRFYTNAYTKSDKLISEGKTKHNYELNGNTSTYNGISNKNDFANGFNNHRNNVLDKSDSAKMRKFN